MQALVCTRVEEAQSVYETYLSATQTLATTYPLSFDVRLELSERIQNAATACKDFAEFDAFFQGERLFLEGDAKEALKYYMQAKTLRNYQFFCLRATAQIFEQAQKKDLALNAVNKALEIYPEDACMLAMKEALEPVAVATTVQIEAPAPVAAQQTAMSTELEFDFLQDIDTGFDFGDSLTESIKFDSTPAKLATIEAIPSLLRPQTTRVESSDLLPLSLKLTVDASSRHIQASLEAYLNRMEKRGALKEEVCVLFNGFVPAAERKASAILEDLLPTQYRATSHGTYIVYNGRGIVIDPGRNFLENFHNEGYFVRDIHDVIVTQNSETTTADIEAIYNLNYRVNARASTHHAIHYYLNQQTFNRLSVKLKPHYKQERDTVHCLELYLDSPDFETVNLTQDIALSYFQDPSHTASGTLGLRLNLYRGSEQISVGYLSATQWLPAYGNYLSKVDIMLAGFQTAQAEDGACEAKATLGYAGLATLLKEVKPRMQICQDFSGSDADLRVETVRALRELATPSIVLPSEIGLRVQLKDLDVRTSDGKYTQASHLRVIRQADSFSSLKFVLAADCL